MITFIEKDTIVGKGLNNIIFCPTVAGLKLFLPQPFEGKSLHVFFPERHGITIWTNDPKIHFWSKSFSSKIEIPDQDLLIGSTFTFDAFMGHWRFRLHSPEKTPKYHFKD